MNSKPSFKDFMLFEDLATDVLNLQRQISDLQARKARVSKPLDDQLNRLQQMLAVKQKQLAAEKQKQAAMQQQPA